MTITDLPITATTAPITLDLYKDIHKGIRVELFSVTAEAGRLDPSQGIARAALATHVGDVVHLLTGHAEHEDAAIQPVLEAHLPDLAERIEVDHLTLEARMDDLVEMATEAASLTVADPGAKVHRIYLALASFTSDYLGTRTSRSASSCRRSKPRSGFPRSLTIHQAILANMPPEEMAKGLAVMIPAMNIDDRTALLGGMRAGAPAEVFDGVWSLVGSVLEPDDYRALARRLDIV